MKISPPSTTSFRLGALALGLTLAAAGGCATDDELDVDIDRIADDLEQENGGLIMSDDDPMFGEAALFSELNLDDVETDIIDDYASDTDVRGVMDAPDAVIDSVVIMWGGGDRPRDWSGTIRVSDGVILAKRAIRFEGDDGVLPRTDRQSISFTSRTLRHRDGLRLLLGASVDKAEGRTLTYEIGGESHSVSIDELLDAPKSHDVGDNGDRIVAMARRRPVDLCENGTMRGHWLQLGRGFGVFRGRVSDDDGQLTGHMKGLYGVRRNGERVFFGKYIGRTGQFRGIFAGTYRAGHFAGRWLSRAGEHGVLGGVYRESLPGARKGGGYLGRWAETSCHSRISAELP